jgi:cell wall-associated NlpC family hydrolase
LKRREKKMAKTASDVLKVAISQIGICEKPKNSNNVKYNTWFYGHPVSGSAYAWCATLVDWCFEQAKAGSLFPHNANAAYAQDEVVSKCGGAWVMKKNTSKATRKAYLAKARPGDIVDFDFGAMDAYRRHIGIVEKVSGSNIIVIEGNTTPDGKSGSQANGGMVCRKTRSYLSVCSAARPAYSGAVPVPTPKPDPVTKPLTVDGIIGYQTACRMQNWLGVSVDGEIGPNTIRALQKKIGAKPVDGKWGKHTSEVFQRYLNANGAKLADDGVFGKKSVKALQIFLNKYYAPKPKPTPKPAAKTSAEKICDQAKACAWPEGTAKSKYSYPGGSATAAFKAAIAKAYPNRSKWGTQTRAGASCDVFVGTVIRSTGYDTKFPRGLDGVEKHCKDNPLWKNTGIRDLDELKPGDVVFYLYRGGGHIYIYVGNGKIANAHYNGKTYGIIQKISTARKPADTTEFIVYRAAK